MSSGCRPVAAGAAVCWSDHAASGTVAEMGRGGTSPTPSGLVGGGMVGRAESASGPVQEAIPKTGWGALPPSGGSTGEAWGVVGPKGRIGRETMTATGGASR